MICKSVKYAAVLCLVSILSASATDVGPRRALLSGGGAPSWVLRGNGIPATLDYDFANGRCYQLGQTGNCSTLLTTSRASTAYADDLAGIWYSFGSNVPRITNKGLLVEEARTNDALWSRDLTNVAWVKVGMGTALNAVGIDGAANSATTLTGTGTASSCTASCTALQTIILGSTADTYSVWLKRVTGSGTVNITINNLVGATACTLTTTSFTRCSVTATLANPVVGIQLTVLNDVVVADFNQMEPGSFVTSPILTTSAAVTRAADVVTVTNVPVFGSQWTYLSRFNLAAAVANTATMAISDGSNNNRSITVTTGTPTLRNLVVSGGVTQAQMDNIGTLTANTNYVHATAISLNDFATSLNGATPVADVSGSVPSGTMSSVRVGVAVTGSPVGSNYISRVAIWPTTRLTNSTLQSLTQ